MAARGRRRLSEEELRERRLQSPLTARQRQVVWTILDLHADKGRPPTIRDIMHRLGIKSPNGVEYTLDALEKKGALTREPLLEGTIILVADRIAEPL